ncbi:hypothetical protein [Chryseobacterium carnipullorum]|nr:hypothetical protein [Chryseobacterium carnipullorum]
METQKYSEYFFFIWVSFGENILFHELVKRLYGMVVSAIGCSRSFQA